MYEVKRKESHATYASTSSPESSPLTPGLDAPPPEPRFSEYSVQSATLESIGAWSAVQPNPNPPATSDDQSYGLGSDMRSLTSKYSALHLDQPQPHRPAPTRTTSPGDGDQHEYMPSSQAHSADFDYTELDEAILRGRSTTLPDIFAVSNPLYRFSAGSTSAGMDPSTLSGLISPVSNSTFSMLSRHGSVSIANSNRTVSPLGLPLSANPIHQSASLDNRFTSTRDLARPPAGSNPVPHAPIRRFSEIPAEANSCLALASYAMAPHFASGSSDAADATNSSGASHGAAGRPTFVPSVISAPATSNSGMVSSLPVSQANACTRFGSFSYHLPTMREEESPSAPLSSPTFADSVLMRNMGLSAMPLPQSGESAATTAVGVDDSSHLLSNGVASPPGLRESDLAPGGLPAKAEIPADRDIGTGGSYLPLRVKSLKDLRRPSLDVRGDYALTSEADDRVASAFFERAAERQSSMSLSHLPGLGRRHSLSTSILSLPNSASAASLAQARVDPGTGGLSLDHEHGSAFPYQADSEYSAYPQFLHSGAFPLAPAPVPVPGPAPEPAMRPYGPPPAQFPLQLQPYHPFALGSAPIARVPGGPSANNHVQPVGPGMYNAHLFGAMPPHQYPYMNHMAYPAMYHHPQLPLMPAHLAEHLPPLAQPVPAPVPVATASQTPQQQYLLQQQHHMRRASHPAISSIGGVTSAAPSSGVVHSGSHPLLPNPATTITPNKPFADMGKGLPFSSLPKGTRVFVVQFKGKRSDLYFAPNKGMEPILIPTLAPSAQPIPPATAPPHEAAARQLGAGYEVGTFVLVEADRGVDLGLIKEELSTTESILSFSSSIPEIVCADNAAEHTCSTAAKPASTGESQVSSSSSSLSSKDFKIKRIFRVADQREVADLMNNKVVDEQKALSMCQDKVQQRKLSMHVADAEFQFDRRKLTFYFTADRRVDFRELVRELFKHFKTRIWMCQLTH
ncbi:hypothetical protein IWW37_002752 [Coemansia sp. RSA 2050]|nr:hypothetical protein IWW37_002752 [Coemansia sp. RSA 2050]KAJ2735584.1 hypothetical protein IW152_001505 [Coemansia sp. BCRC 34962]